MRIGAIVAITAAVIGGAAAVTAGATAQPVRAVACAVPAAGGTATPATPKIVHIDAVGLSCSRAERIARAVTQHLAKGALPSLPGAATVAVSSSAASATCPARAQVTVREASGGHVTVTVKGGLKNLLRGASPPVPLPLPPLPALPPLAALPGGSPGSTLV